MADIEVPHELEAELLTDPAISLIGTHVKDSIAYYRDN